MVILLVWWKAEFKFHRGLFSDRK